MNVYIIAEAGASHGGHLDTAVDLIYTAKEAGADCVKFQAWKTEKFVAPSSPQYKAFKQMEFNEQHWEFIKGHCDEAGIDFLASAWDLESVDMLDKMGMKAFKIGSGDITCKPILKYIGSKGKPIYLSTGMATWKEIVKALLWLEYGRNEITLMKCTVDYPCSEDDVNLAGMGTLDFKHCKRGFSDHTKGDTASCMAVALGAVVIEKHFALNETDEAIGAEQFKEFVGQVRQAERIMGSAELRTFACEEKWKPIARRGESGLRE